MTPLVYRAIDPNIKDRCSAALIVGSESRVHYISRIVPKYNLAIIRGNLSERVYSADKTGEKYNRIDPIHNIYSFISNTSVRNFLITDYTVNFGKLHIEKITEVFIDPFSEDATINTAMRIDDITTTHYAMMRLAASDSAMIRVFNSVNWTLPDCTIKDSFQRRGQKDE